MQTMQQKRAKFALEGVEKAAQALEQQHHKEYHSHVSALPFMIHANGLGQAAAFYRSKATDKPDYQHIYQLLSDWLTHSGQPFHGYDDLLKGITNSEMPTYLTAQAEAMVFIGWVKRFAETLMRHEPEGETQ